MVIRHMEFMGWKLSISHPFGERKFGRMHSFKGVAFRFFYRVVFLRRSND